MLRELTHHLYMRNSGAKRLRESPKSVAWKGPFVLGGFQSIGSQLQLWSLRHYPAAPFADLLERLIMADLVPGLLGQRDRDRDVRSGCWRDGLGHDRSLRARRA